MTKKLICSECKEEIDGEIGVMKGDDIYCAGVKSPHDHYRTQDEAEEYCASDEIKEGYVKEE